MLRSGTVPFLSLVTCLLLLLASPVRAHLAEEGGHSITNPGIQDYFDRRGGARTLGQPISREFDFLGVRAQFFQRAVLHQRSDGSVGPIDILDESLMPYVRIGGLTLPAIDPAMVQAAPSPTEPDFAEKALAFLREHTPDDWEGVKVDFYTTFTSTITHQDVLPEADGDATLVPLVNLEVWGLPTSKPARDPNNHDFVYQRFQRGILHFDQSSGHAKWLPAGEYLRSVLTGRDLPPDLDQAAKGSKLYRQYDNSLPLGVGNPADLPNTNMFAAFERDGVVVPTPEPTPLPTAIPSPTPEPSAASNAPKSKPDWIEIVGSEWFVEQTKYALAVVPDTVREYIWRIAESRDRSHFDMPNHTLYVIEADAFTPTLRESRDTQINWYAGWIIHVAVHGEQYWGGRSTTGLEAEREAWLRQKDFHVNNDNTEGRFATRITNALNRKDLNFTDWSKP